MGCLIEFLVYGFGEVLVAGTGHAILWVVTLGRHRPGDENWHIALGVGIVVWIAIFVAVYLLASGR